MIYIKMIEIEEEDLYKKMNFKEIRKIQKQYNSFDKIPFKYLPELTEEIFKDAVNRKKFHKEMKEAGLENITKDSGEESLGEGLMILTDCGLISDNWGEMVTKGKQTWYVFIDDLHDIRWKTETYPDDVYGGVIMDVWVNRVLKD